MLGSLFGVPFNTADLDPSRSSSFLGILMRLCLLECLCYQVRRALVHTLDVGCGARVDDLPVRAKGRRSRCGISVLLRGGGSDNP